MKKREPIELRKLKPETTSARLTRVVTGLKTCSTRIRTTMSVKNIDDDRRLKELNVDPEEVLNREPH